VSKILDPVQAAGRDLALVCGSFAPQGTGAPTILAGSAEFTIVRTNPGEFALFFDPLYSELVSKFGSIQMAAATNVVIEWGSFAVQAVLQGSRWRGFIYTTTAGAGVDLAADPSTIVSFGCIFRRTGIER